MMLTTIVLAFLAALPHSASVQEKPAAKQATSLAAERRELAEIRLLLGADRKYAEAKQRLGLLVEWLSKRTDEDSRALLGEVEELSRSVRRALGEQVEEGRSVTADVTTRRPGDTVEEAVLAALARKDTTFLQQLGVRAGPGLALAVREDPDELTGDHVVDALFLLLQRDPRRADEVLAELLEHDDFFWKKRAVRALAYATPWSGKALFSTESPRRWLGPGIQATLEKYAPDPDVGNDAFFQLGELVDAGAESAVFRSLLAESLRSPDALRRDVAERVVARHDDRERLRPILERALQEGDAELRGFAAQALAEDPGARSLLFHANDDQLEVRKAVFERLEKSDVNQWKKEEADALARLLVDEDKELQGQASSLLSKLPRKPVVTLLPSERMTPGYAGEFRREEYVTPLPDDVYRSLAKHAVPGHRAWLASVAKALPAPLCFELMALLASDREFEVAVMVVQHLDALPHWADPEALLRIASLLRARSDLTNDQRIENALSHLRETRAGMVAFARWIMTQGATDLVDRIDGKQLGEVDPELFGEFLTWRFERELFVPGPIWKWKFPAMRAVAEDRSRPLVLRMLALQSVCDDRTRWDETIGATVDEVLADPSWGTVEQERWQWIGENLSELIKELPGEARNRAIAAMLDNPAFPAWLAVFPSDDFDRTSPGAAAIGKRVLQRWFGDEQASNRAVREAIGAMATLPELRDDRVLEEATRRAAYSATAWNTIAYLKDPAFLPLIRAALEESGEHRAAEALFGYLSDEAAELLLLAAAKVKTTELRDQCLAHLDKIRDYQDSRERWATRKAKTATREQVIAQLVEQLSAKSDDVKIQAIRALATWEAVEVMPRLIELTSTGSKPVAAAAREALDRLNAPKKD